MSRSNRQIWAAERRAGGGGWPAPRPGWSLVEVLVAVAILGVILALIMSGVQRARHAAARTRCLDQMRQLGLALHGYHDANRHLPAGYDARQRPRPRAVPELAGADPPAPRTNRPLAANGSRVPPGPQLPVARPRGAGHGRARVRVPGRRPHRRPGVPKTSPGTRSRTPRTSGWSGGTPASPTGCCTWTRGTAWATRPTAPRTRS